jgi:hypothetical protein
MSGALAIAGVTAALKDRLNNGLLDQNLAPVGSFSVTAQPPDRISVGATEGNVINVFLYQVTPNLGWRNADLPSRDNGGARVTNPPLALDLHYLVTAYGSQDMNAEVLLGYAMQVLHETHPAYAVPAARAAAAVAIMTVVTIDVLIAVLRVLLGVADESGVLRDRDARLRIHS